MLVPGKRKCEECRTTGSLAPQVRTAVSLESLATACNHLGDYQRQHALVKEFFGQLVLVVVPSLRIRPGRVSGLVQHGGHSGVCSTA